MDLEVTWGERLAERDRIVDEVLVAFNALFEEHDIPAVTAPEEPEPTIEGGEESKGF